MKFAIRDDDTSYFTKPNELLEAYSFLENGCVSLSIVPFTVPIHKDSVFPYGRGIKYGLYDIANNTELVDFLKENILIGKYDILLHGYSHEYKKENGSWQAEMIWKSQNELERELREGKNHLENIFKRKIEVFVAPNNTIDKKAISVIEDLDMNYSGIILGNDRKVNHYYIINFIKRWGYRALWKIPYPGVLNYGKHKELVAYTLDNYERLITEYKACKKHNQPFVIYTHYWKVNEDAYTKNLLQKITEYVLDDGADLVGLSNCFGE